MDDNAVTQILADYYSAFSTLDVQAIARYYHEPCLLIGPQGIAAMPTHAELAEFFTPMVKDLRAKGYSRSEFDMLDIKRLSPTTALASGVAVRYRAGEQELERVGLSYLLHKADGRWAIAVIMAHEANGDAPPV